LHGVRPDISATAGSGDEIRIDESANAAEKAFRFELAISFVFSWFC
jgi:hypothetical protein